MSVDAWLMVGILVIMFAFLAWDRFPAWLVFMGTLTTAMTLKLAPAEALLTGFSNTGVMTVAALFPVAAGMYATGAISLLSQRLIGRPESFDRLDSHAQGGGEQPLVILGESGSGKSALLANWAKRHREQHPEVLLLQHYIGASPYSADWATMLRRIMGELKRKLDEADSRTLEEELALKSAGEA